MWLARPIGLLGLTGSLFLLGNLDLVEYPSLSRTPVLFNLRHHPVVCTLVSIARIQPRPLIFSMLARTSAGYGWVWVGYVKIQWVRVISQKSMPKVMKIVQPSHYTHHVMRSYLVIVPPALSFSKTLQQRSKSGCKVLTNQISVYARVPPQANLIGRCFHPLFENGST